MLPSSHRCGAMPKITQIAKLIRQPAKTKTNPLSKKANQSKRLVSRFHPLTLTKKIPRRGDNIRNRSVAKQKVTPGAAFLLAGVEQPMDAGANKLLRESPPLTCLG